MEESATLESKLPILNKKVNQLPQNPQVGSCGGVGLGRFPKWLHRQLPKGNSFFKTEDILRKYRLNTVCEEAKCPNRMECYTKKTATFLALGKTCTRACSFCDIDFSKTPKAPEADEPERIALSAQELGLAHVVITMVARDDLEDFGALHIAKIMQAVRQHNPLSSIEVLTSDFCGNHSCLDKILSLKPEVFNHNIETIRRLTPKIRHKATYERTLDVLSYAKKSGGPRFIKSGIMVGLGETSDEVKETLKDLKQAGCDIVTIGHYLQASRLKIPVKAFISPEMFKEYEQFGLEIGIPHMYCGPFVRSSYNANLVLKEVIQ